MLQEHQAKIDASFSRWLPIVQQYAAEFASEASSLRLKPDDRGIVAGWWFHLAVPTLHSTEHHDTSMSWANLAVGRGGQIRQRGGGYGAPSYSRVNVLNTFNGHGRRFPYRDATREEIREAFLSKLTNTIARG